jgi:hypothetical protein
MARRSKFPQVVRQRAGVTDLEREVRGLRRANEILRKASAGGTSRAGALDCRSGGRAAGGPGFPSARRRPPVYAL